jgi:phosphodiesterase/alkaline phosphatase D-like protein
MLEMLMLINTALLTHKLEPSLSYRQQNQVVASKLHSPIKSRYLASAVNASITYTGIAAGDATHDSVVLWTRTTDKTTNQGVVTHLTALISSDPSFKSVPITVAGTTNADRDYTLKLTVNNLKSGKRYYYTFKTDDGVFSPVGTFKTAPAPTQKTAVHFGFSGDADGQWRPYGSTQDFKNLNLDYFIWLGDTIYETSSTISQATADPFINPSQALVDYHRKYREQFEPVTPNGFPGLTDFFASQGHYTLLDNHELGNKQFQSGGAPTGTPAGQGFDGTDSSYDVNTTGTYLNKTDGFKVLVQAYDDYQPIREKVISAPNDPRTDGTQQLYYAQQWGTNSIFINLDDRSYRDIRLKTSAGADDTGSRADNPNRTMLGATQLQWFKQTLLNAQKKKIPWKIIAISSPIDEIGGDGGKSWVGGYRAERNEILKFIADNHIKNVVFLTTDDHQNRINELTYLANPNDPDSKTVVPYTFTIVAGPIGAGGPDAITDHSFSNIKSLADTLASDEISKGIDPIGLDPQFPGLHNVYRESDPDADKLRQPVDFYSPDTFNYVTLDISKDGRTLSINTYGINSYAANTFPEPSQEGAVRHILGFDITAAQSQ